MLVFDLLGLWCAPRRCPFPCVALGASGLYCGAPSVAGKPPWQRSSSTLWCQSIQRISLCFPSPSRSRSFTVYSRRAKARAHPPSPQTLRTCCWGCPRSHSAAWTHARATVFPPSRICSIFPHESCGIRPISFILPVSRCLALKCVWSLWDPLYHYSWTSLFCNCLRSFNEFFPSAKL